jgi:hypothetical protein
MTTADFVCIRDDNEVETHFMDVGSIFRFSYWREARRFAWKVAHENQLSVTKEDRHGWAVCWKRVEARTEPEGGNNG